MRLKGKTGFVTKQLDPSLIAFFLLQRAHKESDRR